MNFYDDLIEEGIYVTPEEVVYIDDRTIHLEDILKHVGNVVFIRMWREIRNFDELLLYIRGLDSMTQFK